MLRAAIAALVGCCACGHAAPTGAEPSRIAVVGAPVDARPLGLDDDLPKLASRAVAMYQAIASALASSSTDCAASAAQLSAIEDANRDAIAATAKVLHAGHDKIQQLRAAIAPLQAEMDTAAQAIAASAAMKACANDAAFSTAIDHLLGEP